MLNNTINDFRYTKSNTTMNAPSQRYDSERILYNNATIAEYLALEAQSDYRHEYEAGRIRAMSGGTLQHSHLAGKIVTFINQEVDRQGKPCMVFTSDARVFISGQQRFYYPDASLVCGPLETAKEDPHSLVNPQLIVEVLSASTEGRDRGDKLHAYSQLASFREYLLIDSRQVRVDLFSRNEEGAWRFAMHTQPEDRVWLQTLETHLLVEALYRDLDLFATEGATGDYPQ